MCANKESCSCGCENKAVASSLNNTKNMELTKPYATTASEDTAVKTEAMIVQSEVINSYDVDEAQCMGGSASKTIKLTLENTGANDTYIPFGGLAGLFSEYSVLELAGVLGKFINPTSGWVANFTGINDNVDAGTPYLVALNNRFTRTPMVIEGFEVIAPDTQLGQDQRTQPLTTVHYPLNMLEAVAVEGSYVPQNVERTNVQLINEKPLIFGEFHGAFYKLLAGSKVNINIKVGAVDLNTFTV